MLDDEAMGRLARLGYGRDARHATPTLPGGLATRPEHRDRLVHVAGRVANLDLMAEAIDAVDGVSAGARWRDGGREQFWHLVDFAPGIALAYVALRRHERAGDVGAMRRTVFALVAHEFDEVPIEDVLSACWRPGWGKSTLPQAMLALAGGAAAAG